MDEPVVDTPQGRTQPGPDALALVADATSAVAWADAADIDQVIQQELERLGRWLQVDRVVLALSPEGQPFVEAGHAWARDGVTPPAATMVEIDPHSPAWRHLLERNPIRINDTAQLADATSASDHMLQDEGITALLCVPLVIGGELGGILNVECMHGPRAWQDDEVTVVSVIGHTLWSARMAATTTADLERHLAQVREVNRVLAATVSRLRAVDEAKDTFVSVASHEVRTPLTTILGFADTLEGRWDQLSEDARRESVRAMGRQARRLDELVRDLLDTSRISAGQEHPDPTDVDVTTVAEEAVAGVGADVIVIGTGTAHVDPRHLARMITNLVANATRHGRPPITVHIGRSSGRVHVTVRDHGDGVPEEFLPRLFQRFAQAKSGDQRDSGGTGLGLAITRELAHLNGGEVTYRPANPGARFVVDLPAAE
jgi:signal transduction histidine kinase